MKCMYISSLLNLIAVRQLENGGFGFWSNEEKYASPFVSYHVGVFFGLAKKFGYSVISDDITQSKEVIHKLLQYLRKIIIPFMYEYVHELVGFLIFIVCSIYAW